MEKLHDAVDHNDPLTRWITGLGATLLVVISLWVGVLVAIAGGLV